ncbi:MAG: DUF5053 domain-containing protein [Muribaculaceae bacterium]|uniref:DUF5053 domain-containing protein n=1 Tax=Sangeribacter muris TaxID=2880703 RepID=UPI0013E8F352|nr:DUF5053 domain-containing protein [Sangeribacter muris]MCX4280744.1 DUF5053 domain-containing protein [Muribaculaceae bacterium]
MSQIQFLNKEDLLRVVNGTYIAQSFFGKSSSWFCQKLNNHMKNGKPCEFTKEEMRVLKDALYTIAFELEDLADELQ